MECGEALFRNKDGRFRQSPAFVDAFSRLVQDMRMFMTAGKDLLRPVMTSSITKWSEIGTSDLICASEDECLGIEYSNQRFSNIVGHAIGLLKRQPGNVYSPSRLTDMMWGRIIVWSLPSVLLSITVSPDNTYILDSIAGADAARAFTERSTRPSNGDGTMTDTFLPHRLLSTAAKGCVEDLLGFESDYEGVTHREKGLFGQL